MASIGIVLKLVAGAAAILSMALTIHLGRTCHPIKALRKVYRMFAGSLQKKDTFFNYEGTKHFLISHGADVHLGAWIDPVRYLIVRACLAGLGFFIGVYFNVFFGLLGLGIGFSLLPILLRHMNDKDNDELTPQIQTLYGLLQVQIHAGVPMAAALSESYQSFPDGRLREALNDFATDLYFNGSFEKALEDFNLKFDNGFIDSLCVILLQARESGQAMELLRDISQQITDLQAALQIKKKEKLNRVTTFCLMGIMGAMIGVSLYAAVTQMFAAVGAF